VHLSKEDEKALDGEFGSSLSVAYRILLAIGEATEAEKLVSIK
jgi:predicted aconitase